MRGFVSKEAQSTTNHRVTAVAADIGLRGRFWRSVDPLVCMSFASVGLSYPRPSPACSMTPENTSKLLILYILSIYKVGGGSEMIGSLGR